MQSTALSSELQLIKCDQLAHFNRRNLAIAGLSILGLADALYMLAYHEGWIDSLYCPFFGNGCNIVGRAKHARHFGIPNAAVGAAGYSAMAAIALWSRKQPLNKRLLPQLGLAAISVAAVSASIFLSWEMATKVRAWCFWCLTSGVINLTIMPLSLINSRALMQQLNNNYHFQVAQ